MAQSQDHLQRLLCILPRYHEMCRECPRWILQFNGLFCFSPHSNSSPVEAWFSTVRAGRQDLAVNYATYVGGKEMVKSDTALRNNPMYSSTDIGDIQKGNYFGPSELIKYHNSQDKKMRDTIESYHDNKKHTLDGVVPAYSDVSLPSKLLDCKRDALCRLSSKKLQGGYLRELIQQAYFQQSIRLSLGTPTEEFFTNLFDATIESIGIRKFDEACRQIQDKLFQILLNALQKRKNKGISYEYDLYIFHRSEEFTLLCQSALPGRLAESRPGCVMMCLAMSQLHSDWLKEALIESQKIRNPDRFHKKSRRELSSVKQHNEVNRFIGWAIFSSNKRFKEKYNLKNYECSQLFLSMFLRAREMNDEYVENYYDMASLNNGGLTLVNFFL